MGLTRLSDALRLPAKARLALVGAGGKTSSLFRIAREMASPVIVSATTHLSVAQTQLADRHFVVQSERDLERIFAESLSVVTLLTGPAGQDDRTSGLPENVLDALRHLADEQGLPILLEADGSRQKPLKAPAVHEPAIPEWVEQVVILAGMRGIGKPLSTEWVHRPEIFASLSGLQMGDAIGLDALKKVLVDPMGGMKGIPSGADVSLLLNQVDTDETIGQAYALAEMVRDRIPRVVIASLLQNAIHAVIEPTAGVVLAAGEARRMGKTKQLLDWRGEPFIRRVAGVALASGLSPVIVVTGAAHAEVEAALDGMPVQLVHNPDWNSGQGSSVAVGARSLPHGVGSAIFLLADQPQVSGEVIARLVEDHSKTLDAVIAPAVQGRRANPVIFDRQVFPALTELSGEMGGRAIFSQFPVKLLPWDDERLLMDVDTPEDYRRLLAMG